MNEWTKEQTIEAVTRLIELTQSEEMAWIPGDDSPKRVGYPYTPPYHAEYKGRRWRIQGEMREASPMDKALRSAITGDDGSRRNVLLELVDYRGRTLLELPKVPNLGALLREVQRQSTKPEDVLEELFG